MHLSNSFMPHDLLIAKIHAYEHGVIINYCFLKDILLN